MEEPATTLEAAIADCGLLLVELEKLAGHREDALTALRAEAMAIGQEARRQHRARGLDDAAIAASLVDRAHAVVVRARDAVTALRQAPAYRAAVAAHRTGDHAALARLLPAVLDGLEWVAEPPAALPRHVVDAAEPSAAGRRGGTPCRPGTRRGHPRGRRCARPGDRSGAAGRTARHRARWGVAGAPALRAGLSYRTPCSASAPRARCSSTSPSSGRPSMWCFPSRSTRTSWAKSPLDHPRYRESLVAALGALGFVARAA